MIISASFSLTTYNKSAFRTRLCISLFSSLSNFAPGSNKDTRSCLFASTSSFMRESHCFAIPDTPTSFSMKQVYHKRNGLSRGLAANYRVRQNTTYILFVTMIAMLAPENRLLDDHHCSRRVRERRGLHCHRQQRPVAS